MSEYIDRRIIQEKLTELLELNWGYKGMEEDVASILDVLPKANVAPVVHAHWELCVERTTSRAGWITDTAFHRCSKCHGRAGKDNVGPFCTFCGAKMDEEVNGKK